MLRAFGRPAASPAPAATDDSLVSAVRDGQAGFADLYDHYLPRVYRYLYARVQSPEDAADLTQAVFLRAYTALPRYKSGNTPFVAWLFRIARNAAVDHQRRRRPSVPLEPLAGNLQDHQASPEALALQGERLANLRSLLAGLKPQERDLLALRFAAGLSSSEIAALVGKSEAATKKQLTRTIHALKEYYRDELP